MSGRTLFNNLFLLMCAALTGGLLWGVLLSPHQDISLTDKNYDAFATQVVSTKFSDQGTKKYELFSPRLNHYKTNNQTRIETPQLYMYNNLQEAWLITAQYALATQGSQIIEFIQHVDISGARTLNHKNTQLLTEKITYYSDKNTAHTSLPVTIIQPGSIIHATGMDAAFNTGTMTLLSKIRGSYDPNEHS